MKTAHEFLTDKGGKRSYSALEVHSMLNEYAEQFKPKWIPVSERLPEEGQIVDIFSVTEGRQTDVVFENGCFITYLMLPFQWTMIKYWMPLPPIPVK